MQKTAKEPTIIPLNGNFIAWIIPPAKASQTTQKVISLKYSSLSPVVLSAVMPFLLTLAKAFSFDKILFKR
jgi:hypothetical protein